MLWSWRKKLVPVALPDKLCRKDKKGAVDSVHELYPMLIHVIHRHLNTLPQFPILIIIRKKDRGLVNNCFLVYLLQSYVYLFIYLWIKVTFFLKKKILKTWNYTRLRPKHPRILFCTNIQIRKSWILFITWPKEKLICSLYKHSCKEHDYIRITFYVSAKLEIICECIIANSI